MKKIRNGLILLILSLVVVQNVFATGSLYVRKRWSSDNYQKVWIKSLNVDVKIQDQIAETYVDQTFHNELNTSVEAIYIFPLPENAMITEMAYWVGDQRYEAVIRERQEAVNDYNQHLNQWLDPALLEQLGDNLYRLKIVPVAANADLRTEVRYVEMCDYDFGKTTYEYFLNTTDLSSKPLQTVHLKLDAKTQNTFKYFESPSHESSTATLLKKEDDKHYTLEFGDENFYPDTDLEIEWETRREDVQYSLLTYTPTEEDSMGTSSFYALWVTPPDEIEDDEIVNRNIVFTADVSSSMDGDRIKALKESLQNFLDRLNPQDKFNIVIFGTNVQTFKNDLVEASEANLSEAENFVSHIYALGMTNISDALETSMEQSFSDSSSNILIFLTDGLPTIGETNIDSIVARTTRANNKNVHIYSFGIGETLSERLLKQLSLKNHGYSYFIEFDDDIEEVVNNHFNCISKPVMADLEFEFNGLDPWDNYPKEKMDLFWGSQTMELGLYDAGGEFNVTLTGMMRDEIVSYTDALAFYDTPGQGYRFVPRLWAMSKIEHLMELIDVYGETDELINQIIDLSLTFQILTEYTALYAEPGDETAIDDEVDVAGKFKLNQNYPNPFNPTTTISFNIPVQSNVKLIVYDMQGKVVQMLVNENRNAGNYSLSFDATGLPSGIYFYRLLVGSEYVETKKMIFMK
ncbi:MAG: VWA domain-containing protein [Candidatus Marinimicrobia bacterium]|nr:VWA domain-containing protein [Candidatus Neomarinimicrobiota bacterium]